MVKKITFFTLCLFLGTIFSCNNDDDGTSSLESLVEQLCEPSAPAYFRGFLSGENLCWNEGIEDFQSYSGSGSAGEPGGNTSYFWQIGVDQFPVTDNSQRIFILIESESDPLTLDRSEFLSSLNLGEYPFEKITTTDDVLSVVVQYSSGNDFYSTEFGPQDDAKLEILERVESVAIGNTDRLYLKIRFNCKLYDSNGTIKEVIEVGEVAGSAIRVF